MLIDMSTSIAISFSVIVPALIQVYQIYMDERRINKGKHYFIVFLATFTALFAIFILHNWDNIIHFIENMIATIGATFERSVTEIISSIESASEHTKAEIISFDLHKEDIFRNIGFILLVIYYFLPWIPLYYTIIRTSHKYHSFTLPGVFFSLFILPPLVIFLEVKFSMWALALLSSLNATTHLIWVEITGVCLNALIVRRIIK